MFDLFFESICVNTAMKCIYFYLFYQELFKGKNKINIKGKKKIKRNIMIIYYFYFSSRPIKFLTKQMCLLITAVICKSLLYL